MTNAQQRAVSGLYDASLTRVVPNLAAQPTEVIHWQRLGASGVVKALRNNAPPDNPWLAALSKQDSACGAVGNYDGCAPVTNRIGVLSFPWP